jgi:hypothetical protein
MTLRSMKYAVVLGSQMAYIDECFGAAGAPVAPLLQGNPTSSYLWRNVILRLACATSHLISSGSETPTRPPSPIASRIMLAISKRSSKPSNWKTRS